MLFKSPSSVLSWEHADTQEVSLQLERLGSRIITERLHLWAVLSCYVRDSGQLQPLKLFRHATQSFYSGTKGAVDRKAQYWSILRSSSVVYK